MPSYRDRRAAQVAAMADPERVQLLNLILTDRTGELTAEMIAGVTRNPIDVDWVRSNLAELASVGLLVAETVPAGTTIFRPSHDALARFGSLTSSPFTSPLPADDHAKPLERVSQTLVRRFDDVLAPETVREFVVETYDLLARRATVRRFLPQLTERFAAERLEALASIEDEGGYVDDVLFVCVRNAGRSQIAAAFMRDRAGGSIRIRTAGSAPVAHVDPVVQQELVRRGLNVVTEFPRPLTSEVVRASGVVVTMGCGDACPIVPGRRYIDWKVDDPVGKSHQEVRRIADDISARVDRLIGEMGVASS